MIYLLRTRDVVIILAQLLTLEIHKNLSCEDEFWYAVIPLFTGIALSVASVGGINSNRVNRKHSSNFQVTCFW